MDESQKIDLRKLLNRYQDKEINMHGDEIPISIVCNNSSSKTVTCIRVSEIYLVEMFCFDEKSTKKHLA